MKLTKKLLTYFSLALIFSAFLTSCQDPILYHVRQEVKLEEATMLGDIFSVIRFTDANNFESLYVANGKIFTKSAYNETHGSWIQTSKPNGHVHSLAADKDYLYAFVVNFDTDGNEGETELSSRSLYYLDKNGFWNRHPLSGVMGSDEYQNVTLMCTNAVQKDHRAAFININNTVYKLEGDSFTDFTPYGTYGKNSCAWLNGTVFFFDYFAACSDETAYSDATCIFYGDYTQLKVMDSTGNVSVLSTAANGIITGLAVMNDSVLATSQNGTVLIDRATGKAMEFKNLSSTMSTIYETYAPLAVFPERNALQNIIYASNQVEGTGSNSAQFTHQGLWSYYPSRGKWNIE
ncbi:MAG: hypothetical protein KBT21_05825 [Treponema sp.]|nr:hypothetical protein [Candidatus Treponema merdequi]